MKYSLGQKIQYLRKKEEFSQQDLSCEILSRTILSKIENDKVIPSIFQLKHIAERLNVSMEYLLNNNIDYLTSIKSYSQDSVYNLYLEKKFHVITASYEKGFIDSSINLNCLFYVGYSYFMTEFYTESEKVLKKYIKSYTSLSISEQDLYIENLITAFNILCVNLNQKYNYSKSLEYSLQAKEILENHNMLNTRVYNVVIRNISALHIKMLSYDNAIEILEAFLSNNFSVINLDVLASIHLNLNIAYYNLQDYENSIKHIKNAIFFYNYIGKKDDAKGCYLNYINAFRYDNKFTEAFAVLSEFKRLYWNDLNPKLKINFLMQEIILYFNINDYESVLPLLNKFNLNQLDSYDRNVYYFIKGHIEFANKNFTPACDYLLKCEKYFNKHHYIYDLKLLYSDLYEITNDDEFKIKLEQCNASTSNCRKNILIS